MNISFHAKMETFHVKMGTIKDTNGMDLTETEDIKKRWQEYTEELYKKDLPDPDNYGGVSTPFTAKEMQKGKIVPKDGHNKGQKWYGPNRNRRY